jgi:hypothetical protein
MRLAFATLAMLALPLLLPWPFHVSFDELVLLIVASVVQGMWHETIVFAKVLIGTIVLLGLLALWQKLCS